MTETECMNCDWSENCDWELIVANFTPMSPKCQHKAWHEGALNTFEEMTQCVREKIYKTVTVGEFYKNSQKNNWDEM